MNAALEIAASQVGLTEQQGAAAISDYLATGGVNLDPVTTAWCAAFVNSTLSQAGMQGTGSNAARSFMNWGEAVDTPQRGDLAVFSRGDPNGWQGHVGFFDGYNEDGSIRVLGGNQSDGVNVATYGADRLLGFRRAAQGATEGPVQQQVGLPAWVSGQAPPQAPERPSQPVLNWQSNPLDPAAFQRRDRNRLAPMGFDPQTNPFAVG